MFRDLIAGPGIRKLGNVPIITYHSIADVKDDWQFRHLSCPVSIFESHLKALRWAGFRTISLQMLYGYMAEGKEIPSRSVVLTFDDGYLDNWVYVYPLLKKYNLHGTIFVNPAFVDPSEAPRPGLEDVWSGRSSMHDLPTSGFLSWQEMREMESSGTIDIQSHGLTHTWYFSSAEILDFHHPGDSYPWLAWNVRPERKHLWMTEDQRAFVPWGTPVYRHEKSLTTRRYFPDQDLDTVLVDYVRSRGNETFFQSVDWRQQLEQVATDYCQSHADRGRFESDAEYKTRLHCELAESKRIIEKQLDKKVDFLCWPGGGYNETSMEISSEVGYLSSAHSSWDKDIPKNQLGENPSHWSRISPPAFHWGENRVEYKGGLYLIGLLNSVRGGYFHAAMYKALKIPFKLSQWYGRFRKSNRYVRVAGREVDGSVYQIDRHATLVELDALEKEWSELLDEIPGVPVFLTWEWIRTWWLYFGEGRQLWLLTARDKQGRLLGLAPLMREEYKKGLIKLDMIAFIGTGPVCPTRLNILARASDHEGLYQAFLDFLLGQSDQWDVLRITSVELNSIENNLLMAAGGRIRIGAQVTSPYLPLPINWEMYLKTASSKLRRNIKSSTSKLGRDFPGVMDFAYVTDPQELESAMEKLVELIRKRCHAKGLFTDWDDPAFIGFHQAIARLALNRGWLRLFTLTVKDCVVALNYSFRFKDCIYGYNGGFDADWSSYDPGRLLFAHTIQTAIRESASELDFGRGESAYKFNWTDHVRVENEILFSSNWKGDLWIKLGNFKKILVIKASQITKMLKTPFKLSQWYAHFVEATGLFR